MRFTQASSWSAAIAAALAISLAPPIGATQAKAKTYLMKISVPTIHDIPNAWISGYAKALQKDSNHRIKVKVYPASQLGAIPRQIEGTQFGDIQCEVVPPVFMTGIDPRFQLLAAPGLVDSEAQAQRLVAEPAVRKLMLGLGAGEGLHGVGLFFAEPNLLISRTPLRHLSDFKGKKIRIFASPFEIQAFQRLGMTPVAMTLGDVVPALQEGTIDGSITGIGPIVNFHMIDTAKYVTEIDQPGIFIIVETNRKWYDSLPKDLQHIVDRAAAKEDASIDPIALKMRTAELREWKASGGTLIKLPPAEYARMTKTLGTVGIEVSSTNPKLAAAYKVVTQAAQRAAGSVKTAARAAPAAN